MAKITERPLLASNIRARRRQRGWSQEVLAEEAKIGLNTLKDIERGKSRGSDITLSAIAGVFECSVDDLYRDFTARVPHYIDSAMEKDDISIMARYIDRIHREKEAAIKDAAALALEINRLISEKRELADLQRVCPPGAALELSAKQLQTIREMAEHFVAANRAAAESAEAPHPLHKTQSIKSRKDDA